MIQDFFLISTTHWLLWIGITLLILEVAFFGIATFVLFFIGLAMLVVAGLMGIEIIPGDPQTAIIAVSIVTLLSAAALWRPLRRLQSGTTNANNEVGFIFIHPELGEFILFAQGVANPYAHIWASPQKGYGQFFKCGESRENLPRRTGKGKFI